MNTEIVDKLTIFLDSDMESITLPYMIAIRDFEKILLSFGFDKLSLTGDETNGWQVDFWYKFNHINLGQFMLSGSLHYGNFVFSKYKEDE